METPVTSDISAIFNIVGEHTALGPLRRELIPIYCRWINDLAVAQNLVPRPLPMTLDQETSWYEWASTNPDLITFTIYERATNRPIGNTALSQIDYRNRTAMWGILIGEADARGRGYGTEVTRLMLDYAFTALGLHSVALTVAEYNLAARRAYAKAGFTEVGRRRACRLAGGSFWDTIYMDCLATEFTSPWLSEVFVPDRPRPSEDTRS